MNLVSNNRVVDLLLTCSSRRPRQPRTPQRTDRCWPRTRPGAAPAPARGGRSRSCRPCPVRSLRDGESKGATTCKTESKVRATTRQRVRLSRKRGTQVQPKLSRNKTRATVTHVEAIASHKMAGRLPHLLGVGLPAPLIRLEHRIPTEVQRSAGWDNLAGGATVCSPQQRCPRHQWPYKTLRQKVGRTECVHDLAGSSAEAEDSLGVGRFVVVPAHPNSSGFDRGAKAQGKYRRKSGQCDPESG